MIFEQAVGAAVRPGNLQKAKVLDVLDLRIKLVDVPLVESAVKPEFGRR